MKYLLVIWDGDNNREIPFEIPLPDEDAVIETGAAWIGRFPSDIAMVVEIVEALESEDTHDIYAWTTFWNGVDRPAYNCTQDPRGHRKDKSKGFEHCVNGPDPQVDVAEAMYNIYFFGPKEE